MLQLLNWKNAFNNFAGHNATIVLVVLMSRAQFSQDCPVFLLRFEVLRNEIDFFGFRKAKTFESIDCSAKKTTPRKK